MAEIELKLTEKEAVFLNTLFAMMIANVNGRNAVYEGSERLLITVSDDMTYDEKGALNVKMSNIIKNLSPEITQRYHIGGKFQLEELETKYTKLFEREEDARNN